MTWCPPRSCFRAFHHLHLHVSLCVRVLFCLCCHCHDTFSTFKKGSFIDETCAPIIDTLQHGVGRFIFIVPSVALLLVFLTPLSVPCVVLYCELYMLLLSAQNCFSIILLSISKWFARRPRQDRPLPPTSTHSVRPL